MSQSDRTVKLTVDVQGKVNDLEGQLNKIQRQLSKLKMPDNIGDSANESMNTLKNRIESIKSYLKNNKLNLVNEKEVLSELAIIEKQYSGLFKMINDNSKKFSLQDSLKTSIEEAKALTKVIENYYQTIRQQEESINNLKKKKASEETKRTNLEATKKIFDEAEARRSKAEKALNQDKSILKQQGYNDWEVNEVVKYLDSFKQLEAAEKHIIDINGKFNTTLTDLNTQFNKSNQNIITYENTLKVLEQQLNDLKGTAIQDAVNELKKLESQGKIHLGFDLNTIKSVDDLEENLKNINDQDLKKVISALNKVKSAAQNGSQGAEVLKKEIVETTEKAKNLDKVLDNWKSKIAHFFGIDNAIRLLKRGVREAYNTIKDLDAVMTETAVVTDFSVGDMWNQLPEYTKRANELGVSIHDAYEAATLYYQQGLSTNEVMAVSNETLKMARIAELEAADATDRMTNALRGFNMEITEANAQNINDVYSNLAAKTASNVNEISVAMTKVASLAHNANMSFENTAAFLSQIIETTRESAETAGTALKTVVARFSEVKELHSKGELLGLDTEGEEIDVNKVSKALRSAGINLNEYLTGAKGLDDIFMELSAKWDSLDQVQQRYIATTAAGSRQQSRFIALMQDNARMTELVGEANNAAGASQKQFEKTLDSLQTKLAQLKNAWDTFLMGLANNKIVKGVITSLTKIITLVNKLTGALPGMAKSVANLLAAFGGLTLGKSLGNKGLSKLSLFLKEGKQEAAISGTESARIWGDNFVSQLESHKVLGSIGAFFSKVKAVGTQASEELVKSFRTSLDKNKSTKNLTDDQKNQLTSTFSTQSYTAAENQAKSWGVDLNMKKKSVTEFKAQVTEFQKDFTKIGIAMTSFGALLTQAEGKLGGVGTALSKIGQAAMTSGGILSVTNMLANSLGKTIPGAANVAIMGITAALSIGKSLWNYFNRNSPEERLKRAKKEAEAAGKAAEEAAKHYDELKNSLEKITEGQDKFEKLVVGTEEWRDAVKQTNSEIIELINNYKELSGYVTNEGGKLVLDTDSEEVKSILEGYSQSKTNADLASIAAQRDVAVQEATLSSSKTPFGLYNIDDEAWEGIAKAFAGDIDSLNKYADEHRKILESEDEKLISNLKSWGQTILQNETSIKSLDTATSATIVSMTNLSEEEAKFAANYLNADRLEYFKDKVDISGLDLREEVAKSLGFKDYSEYKESRGGVGLSDDEAEAQYRMIKGAELASDELKVFAKALKNASPEIKKIYGEKGKTGLSENDIKELTGRETIDLSEIIDLDFDNDDEIKDRVKEAYSAIFDIPIDDIDVNSKEFIQFSNDYNDAIKQSAIALVDAKAKIDNIELNTEDLEGFSSLSAEVQKGFVEQLVKVYASSGQEGAQAVLDNFNEVIKNASEEDRESIAKIITSADWKNLDELKGLFGDIDDADVSVNSTNKAFIELINSIEEGADSIRKFNMNSLIDNIKELSQIEKDLRTGKQGSIFSEDAYNKIIGANADLASDFRIGDEGNYVYIGKDINNLIEALDKNTSALLTDAEKQLEAKIALGKEEVEGYDLDTIDDDPEYRKRFFLQNYINQLKDKGVDIAAAGIEGLSEDTPVATLDPDTLNSIISAIKDVKENLPQYEADYQAQRQGEVLTRQKYTAEQNAQAGIEGNQAAIDALQVQAREAGITEEAWEELYNAIEEGGFRASYAIGELAHTTSLLQKADTLGISKEEIDKETSAVKALNKQLSNTEALQQAILNLRANKGIEKLTDSYEDFTKILSENNNQLKANSLEEANIVNELKDSINLLLNTSQPLSDSFFESTENMANLKAYMEGDVDALEKLRYAAAQDIIVQLKAEDDMTPEVESAIDNLFNVLNNVDLPELKPGMDISGIDAGLDDALADFEELLKAGALTVGELNGIFNVAGFESAFEVKEQTIPITGDFTWYNKNTGKDVVSSIAADVATKNVKVYSPQLKFTSLGTPSVPHVNSGRGGNGGGGAGNSGSNKDKNGLWNNPYDELHNKFEQLNEDIRKRIKLEREYELAARDSRKTNEEIGKIFQKQLNNLESQHALHNQIAEARKKTLTDLNSGDIGSYINGEGDRVAFRSHKELTKLVNYDFDNSTLNIDWAAINKFKEKPEDAWKGDFIEAYYNEMQKLIESYEEEIDKMDEISKEVEDIHKDYSERYFSFEERVLDAVIAQREKEIEKLEQMSDAIKDASDKVISGIRDQVEKERQARQNEKTEEELAQKEARLEYLRRDTSGANQNKILQLEKEVEEARQSYEDTLVDQTINKLQKNTNLAAEQRAEQIEVMKEQFKIERENGQLWGRVETLLKTGVTDPNSQLVQTLQETEAYKAMSQLGQKKWMQDLAVAFHDQLIGKDSAIILYNGGIKEAEGGLIGGATIAYPGYDSGGLADFTGPAWLDGTKSKPELVLNAEDTRNFLALNDILGSLLSSNNTITNNNGGGDNYYTIEIDAVLGSDYDVDQLATRLKQKIVEDSSYRNVNSIGFIR